MKSHYEEFLYLVEQTSANHEATLEVMERLLAQNQNPGDPASDGSFDQTSWTACRDYKNALRELHFARERMRVKLGV